MRERLATANGHKQSSTDPFTHSMPCPCRAHAVPLPCCAAKGLECVFPIWFTYCGRVWFTLAMLGPCHALTMPFFSRPRHSTAVERRPLGYVPAFGFFRLPRGVPRRLLSEAYHRETAVGLRARFRLLPATTRSSTKTVIRSIPILPTTIHTCDCNER